MVVIFDDAVKSLRRQVGKEDMKPVTDLGSAEKFQYFNILRRKEKSLSSFWEQPDSPVDFSLLDILDPSSPVPDPSREGPFTYKDNMVQKGKGDLTVDASVGAQVAASGETDKSREFILEFQINKITTKILTDLRSRALLKPEPWFLKQCRERGYNLYVVTESVEVTNSPELRVEKSRKWLGKFSFLQNLYIKVQSHIDGDKKKQQLLTLPEHMVMAYKTKQLIIKENDWEVLLTEDKNQKTFPEGYEERSLTIGYRREILPKEKIEEPVSQDFKKLQNEISRRMEELSNFSKDIQDILFHNILVMLGDRGALQDLQDMMEQFPQGDLDGPGGIILKELRKNLQNSWDYRLSCISYMFEALMVLNDTQHELLAWSMEMKILVHQRELVRSILEPNFRYPWRIPFTLKPELLTPLQDEGVTVTYKLLEECGLMIDLNCNRSFWDLEAKMPLSALYGCLSLLQQLAVA
ncbi:gasdermin-C-like [Sorex araneus]|uniref:gasdermin-C-like n=1 Tax=Sorex araneus TaxID=42254 RepID=UPI002433914A|nr:gasdermin-C-like [Sorex araneus]